MFTYLSAVLVSAVLTQNSDGDICWSSQVLYTLMYMTHVLSRAGQSRVCDVETGAHAHWGQNICQGFNIPDLRVRGLSISAISEQMSMMSSCKTWRTEHSNIILPTFITTELSIHSRNIVWCSADKKYFHLYLYVIQSFSLLHCNLVAIKNMKMMKWGVAAHLEVILTFSTFISREMKKILKTKRCVFIPLTSLLGKSQEKYMSCTSWTVQLMFSVSPCFSTVLEAFM